MNIDLTKFHQEFINQCERCFNDQESIDNCMLATDKFNQLCKIKEPNFYNTLIKYVIFNRTLLEGDIVSIALKEAAFMLTYEKFIGGQL